MNNPIGQTLAIFAILAIISIVSYLITSIYDITDQIFIGQNVDILGNAATNAAFPTTIVCTAVAILFGFGGAARLNSEMGGILPKFMGVGGVALAEPKE